jgi:hypothetical protein
MACRELCFIIHDKIKMVNCFSFPSLFSDKLAIATIFIKPIMQELGTIQIGICVSVLCACFYVTEIHLCT